MAIEGYSAFIIALALLEADYQIVFCHIPDTRCWGVAPPCREAIGVFYSPSKLGHVTFVGEVLPLCWDAVGVDMFSFQHLLTNWSGLQTRWGSPGPLLLGGGFPGHSLSPTDLISNSVGYIIVQSPTQSLEWHVWSSSSGNNCHVIHRSLSSGASDYECTMGFYLVAFFQPRPPTWFLLITAIGMCHFLPVHHFGMACLTGPKVNIQQSYPCAEAVGVFYSPSWREERDETFNNIISECSKLLQNE